MSVMMMVMTPMKAVQEVACHPYPYPNPYRYPYLYLVFYSNTDINSNSNSNTALNTTPTLTLPLTPIKTLEEITDAMIQALVEADLNKLHGAFRLC